MSVSRRSSARAVFQLPTSSRRCSRDWHPFGEQLPLLLFAVLVAALIVYKHRGNITPPAGRDGEPIRSQTRRAAMSCMSSDVEDRLYIVIVANILPEHPRLDQPLRSSARARREATQNTNLVHSRRIARRHRHHRDFNRRPAADAHPGSRTKPARQLPVESAAGFTRRSSFTAARSIATRCHWGIGRGRSSSTRWSGRIRPTNTFSSVCCIALG